MKKLIPILILAMASIAWTPTDKSFDTNYFIVNGTTFKIIVDTTKLSSVATNVVLSQAGTNVNLQTNGLVLTINANVSHAEVNTASNDVFTVMVTRLNNATNDVADRTTASTNDLFTTLDPRIIAALTNDEVRAVVFRTALAATNVDIGGGANRFWSSLKLPYIANSKILCIGAGPTAQRVIGTTVSQTDFEAFFAGLPLGSAAYVSTATFAPAGVPLTNNETRDVVLKTSLVATNTTINLSTLKGLTLHGPNGGIGYEFKWISDHLRLTNSIFPGDWIDFNHGLAFGNGLSTFGSIDTSSGTAVVFTGDGSGLTNLVIGNAAADGTTKGIASFTAADFNATSGNISIDYANGQAATTGAKGFLTSADWNTFNGKQAAGNYITALTGDVTASGPGSVAATIGNNKVTGAMIALGSDASGDIMYYNGTDWVRLPKENNGDLLTLTAGLPDWVSPSASSFNGIFNTTSQIQFTNETIAPAVASFFIWYNVLDSKLTITHGPDHSQGRVFNIDTNGATFFVPVLLNGVDLTIDSLTASRMVLTDSSKHLVSAAASGSIPIDADGTATTFAQINSLAADYLVTNKNANVFNQIGNQTNTGTFSMAGTAMLGSTLAVSGNATLTNNLQVQGTQTNTGNASWAGTAMFGGAMNVAGLAFFTNTVTGNGVVRANSSYNLSGLTVIDSPGSSVIRLPASAGTIISAVAPTPKTANYSLLAQDGGRYINNVGAGGAVTNTLPTAAAGIHYYVYVDVAQILCIQATGSDTIRYEATASAAAGNIFSSTIGGTLHLYSPAATKWIIDQKTGTWTGPQ